LWGELHIHRRGKCNWWSKFFREGKAIFGELRTQERLKKKTRKKKKNETQRIK